MNKNVLEIEKIDEIDSDISLDTGLSENEEFRTIESLKVKLLKLNDKLIKMGEDIQDVEEMLYSDNQRV